MERSPLAAASCPFPHFQLSRANCSPKNSEWKIPDMNNSSFEVTLTTVYWLELFYFIGSYHCSSLTVSKD